MQLRTKLRAIARKAGHTRPRLVVTLWAMSFMVGLVLVVAREFRVAGIQLSEGIRPVVTFPADPAYYYILYYGRQITNIAMAVDVKLGTGPNGTLLGNLVTATNNSGFFRVSAIPVSAPLDQDHDGLSDIFELQHRPFLDPLDPSDARGLTTIATSPANGERSVSPTRETIIYFSRPLTNGTVLTDNQLYATFGGRRLLTRIETSPDLRRATLYYLEPLVGSTTRGAPSDSVIRVTFDATQVYDLIGKRIDANGVGLQGGIATIEFETAGQSPLPGTIVCGRVFASELATRRVGDTNISLHVPLADVTITADGFEDVVRAVTDDQGNFKLTNAPGGPFFVHIDGHTASGPDWTKTNYYPSVGKLWNSIPNYETNIGDIFLPLIIQGTLIAVSPTKPTTITMPTNVVAEHPELNGISLTVPPNSLYSDNGTRGGMVGIAPVPPDRLPSPLPAGFNPPVVITVQTDGPQHFDQPVPICFPNLPDPATGALKPPGSKLVLWSFDHTLGEWVSRGSMTVADDGKTVCCDPGVGIISPGWHFPCDCSPSPPPGCVFCSGDHDQSASCPQPGGGAEELALTCPTCTTVGNPVIPFSGEKLETVEDLRIKGVGIDFVWRRTYGSKHGPNTAQGNGWDFNYNIQLQRSGSGILLSDGKRRSDLLVRRLDGTFGKSGLNISVDTNEPSGPVLKFPNHGQTHFYPFDGSVLSGKTSAISDQYGNSLAFKYDSLGRLTKIVDTLNREISVAYNDDGFIESVTDFAGRKVRYAYYGNNEPGGSFGDLKSVTSPAVIGTPNNNDFPNGKTTSYTYSKGFADERLNHNLLTITDGRRNDPSDSTYGQGAYLVNIYSSATDPDDPQFDRIVRQIRGGSITDFTYLIQPTEQFGGLGYMRTIVRDGVGAVSEFYYDAGNRLRVEREFTGLSRTNEPVTDISNRPTGKLRSDDPEYFETIYDYNADFQITQITHPNGNITRNVYESDLNPAASSLTRNNLREIHRLPGTHQPAGDQNEIVEKYEYDTSFGGCGTCGFNFVTRYTDPKGAEVTSQYDTQGNLLVRTNRMVQIVDRWEYNSRGQIVSHTFPDNGSGYLRTDRMNYYESGPMTGYLKAEIVDAATLQLTTIYEYDSVGNIIRKIDPRGHDRRYIVNYLNQVVREISPEMIDASGIRYAKEFAYDANNNLIRLDVENRDESGALQSNAWFTTTFEYDILNKLTRKTEEVDANGSISTEYVYDANRNRTLVRYGEATAGRQTNNVVSTLYDERKFAFKETRGSGGGDQSTTQIDYDANGNRIRESSGLEGDPHITIYSYDGFDRMVSKMDAMGNVTTNNFDAAGNRTRTLVIGELTDVVGSEGNVRLSETYMTYDEGNRLTNEAVAFFNSTNQLPIDSGWAITQTLYNANSSVFASINPNGHGITNLYDTAHRLVVRIDAKGNSVTNAYDAAANLIQSIEVEKPDIAGPNELFITSMTYDNLNRLIGTSNNVGSVNRSLYDSRDNRVATIDALANKVVFTFDGLNRETKTTRLMTDTGNGQGTVVGQITTRQTWDDSSRLTSQIDDNGNATTYLYDGLNRKISTIVADGTGQTNVLDVHGVAVLFTDGNGNRVTNTYDALDRLVRRDVEVGPGVSAETTFETYQYDGLSRLTRSENNDSVVIRAYDSLSHLIQEIQNDATVNAKVDNAGNQIELHYPGGRVLSTIFDELERIKAISDSNGKIASYWYTGPRRVARREYGNGTRCDYSYDGVVGEPNSSGDFGSRNIVRTRHTRVWDGMVIDDRIYAWDRMGNKTKEGDLRAGGAQIVKQLQYDSAYRMTRSIRLPSSGAGVTNTYEFDGVGNRVSVSGGEDSGGYTMSAAVSEPSDYQLNQYTTTPFDKRTYDSNGNLMTMEAATVQTLIFDYRNRLVEFDGNGSLVHYGYDTFGRRISQKVFGRRDYETSLIYNGWRVLGESNLSNGDWKEFAYGPYIDEVLMVQGKQGMLFSHGDDNNTVLALSDASGSAVESFSYGDYGEPSNFDSSGLPASESPSGNLVLFTGRRFDHETKLYDYRTREFDPRVGRFVSRDSIGIFGDMINTGNAYSFVNNNPFSKVDPFGREGGLTVGAVAASIAAGAAVVAACSTLETSNCDFEGDVEDLPAPKIRRKQCSKVCVPPWACPPLLPGIVWMEGYEKYTYSKKICKRHWDTCFKLRWEPLEEVKVSECSAVCPPNS